jgi:hypothetical protein
MLFVPCEIRHRRQSTIHAGKEDDEEEECHIDCILRLNDDEEIVGEGQVRKAPVLPAFKLSH